KPLFVAVSCWNSIAVSTAFLYAVANSCCRFETAWMYCVTFFSASSKYRFTFCLYTAYASFVSVLLIFSPPVVNYFYGLELQSLGPDHFPCFLLLLFLLRVWRFCHCFQLMS